MTCAIPCCATPDRATRICGRSTARRSAVRKRSRPRRRLRADLSRRARLCLRRPNRFRAKPVRCGARSARARQARWRSLPICARAGLHRPKLRRRRLARAVQSVRMEQDENADPHPGGWTRGNVGLRPLCARPRTRGAASRADGIGAWLTDVNDLSNILRQMTPRRWNKARTWRAALRTNAAEMLRLVEKELCFVRGRRGRPTA